ncbi:MAG: class I SAM-dependent methyltransferase [Planctomycetales bacterium]|nr:class I SAM-dependent methyltransferase [Planctomycetales bacterium]
MMLQRVLEPEVMASHEEALDYDAMDHAAVNRSFVDDLLAEVGEHRWAETFDVLDLGTGTAQIPVELCGRNLDYRVMATDLSTAMLEVAYANINIACLNDRIVLEQEDSKGLSYDPHRFHIVMSNSIVHHVPEPWGVFSEALRMAAPGGLVFFRDLARPDDEATVDHLVATYAGTANARQQKLFADSLRAALRPEEVRDLVREFGCPPESVTATSDRHWTWIYWRPL